MATYKQRTPYNRFNGRRSPEQDSISDTTFNNYNSYNNSNININSTSGPSYINNPYDDILIDQEWTSIRQSTSARVRARQQQFLHQEQQRAQEWHFVLEQHQRRPSLTATITTSTATTTASIQDDDDGIFSDEYVNDISDVESQSVVTSPRGRTQVAMHLPSQMRGASIDHSSTISYSDLASESLDTLDESEDFSVWSQDDDESFSGTTKKSRHYIPKSPSTISLSSITSLNKSQMPFHDGSGNFAARAASQQGSDHESDHGGWESSSSTSSILFRPHHQQQQRLDLTDKKSISPTEFDSVLNDISNFQARHSPNHHKLATGSTETSNRGSSVVPQITISSPSPHARIRRPLGPSKLSTCSIYESEMEDIDAMVPDLPSKQGWLETFEIALNAIRSHEPDLSMEDSTPNNPIKALAQHYSKREIDHVEPSTVHEPEPNIDTISKSQRQHPLSSTSSGATKKSIRPLTGSDKEKLIRRSSNDDDDKTNSNGNNSSNSNNNEVSRDLKKIRQHVSASSLEALQSLQSRHNRANSQDKNEVDPMQIQFSPTIMDDGAGFTPKQSSEYNSSLLVTMVSTLRRFRDHVKSNLLHLEFDEDNGSNLSDMALECGNLVGTEWTVPSSSARHKLVDNDNNNNTHDGGNGNRVLSNSVSHYSSYPNSGMTMSKPSFRRASSDCGLESLVRSSRRPDIIC